MKTKALRAGRVYVVGTATLQYLGKLRMRRGDPLRHRFDMGAGGTLGLTNQEVQQRVLREANELDLFRLGAKA